MDLGHYFSQLTISSILFLFLESGVSSDTLRGVMRLPKEYSSLERRGGCSGVAMLMEQKIAEKTK